MLIFENTSDWTCTIAVAYVNRYQEQCVSNVVAPWISYQGNDEQMLGIAYVCKLWLRTHTWVCQGCV